MNKYIKKCVLLYISMVIILCSMVGVTYAITATDADQYVTRSQYAVDMAHLQNKLDEAEAGLMGNINRFRSTDVKFVTWDTPVNQDSSGPAQGDYNGGNYFLRYRRTASNRYAFGYGVNSINNKKTNYYQNYEIYRLWNGNYYLTKTLAFNDEASSPTEYHPTVNYAVPVENFPGWYMEVRVWHSTYSYASCWMSIIKLDPNSTTPAPLTTDELIFRFKKDLFQYCGTNPGYTFTTTKQTVNSVNVGYQTSEGFNSPFTYVFPTTTNTTSSRNMHFSRWLDPETGDFMSSILNYDGCWGNGSLGRSYRMASGVPFAPCVLIPKDNVEYVCGNITGYALSYRGNWHPNPRHIGTGTNIDPYWEYDFVDCVNGLTYWHAYNAPRDSAPAGATAGFPLPYSIHYSLPIVY